MIGALLHFSLNQPLAINAIGVSIFLVHYVVHVIFKWWVHPLVIHSFIMSASKTCRPSQLVDPCSNKVIKNGCSWCLQNFPSFKCITCEHFGVHKCAIDFSMVSRYIYIWTHDTGMLSCFTYCNPYYHVILISHFIKLNYNSFSKQHL